MAELINKNDGQGDEEKSLPGIFISGEKFAEFILNYLGDRETLSYQTELEFELNQSDLEQFYYLMDEKLSKERSTLLQHFSVSISYEDKSTRKLNGIEQLKKFHETRYVSPASVTLTWTISVDFPSYRGIENQKIELSFYRRSGRRKDDSGYIQLYISHNNQAWAIEILNLLKTKIENVKRSFPRQYQISKWIRDSFSLSLLNSLIGIVIILSLYAAILELKHEYSRKSEIIYSNIEYLTSDDKSEKIVTYALNTLDYKHSTKTIEKYVADKDLKLELKELINVKKMKEEKINNIGNLGLLVIGGFLITFFYPRYVYNHFRTSSHILLTKKSIDEKEIEIKSKSNKTYYSVTFILFSIIVFLVQNYIANMIN